MGKLPSGIEIELVLDHLDHQRMDHADTEIIDRLLAASRLAARPILLVTNDGDMGYNAEMAGLKVVSLLGLPPL